MPRHYSSDDAERDAANEYGPSLTINNVKQSWRWQMDFRDAHLVRLTDGTLGIIRRSTLANHYIRFTPEEVNLLRGQLHEDERASWTKHNLHTSRDSSCHLCRETWEYHP